MSFVILFAFVCCHFCHRSNCFAASFLLVCKWQFEKTNQIQYCTWFLLRFRTAIAEEEMGHIYKNSTHSMRLINLLDYHMNWLGNEQQTLEMYTKRNIHLSWHTLAQTYRIPIFSLYSSLFSFPLRLLTHSRDSSLFTTDRRKTFLFRTSTSLDGKWLSSFRHFFGYVLVGDNRSVPKLNFLLQID